MKGHHPSARDIRRRVDRTSHPTTLAIVDALHDLGDERVRSHLGQLVNGGQGASRGDPGPPEARLVDAVFGRAGLLAARRSAREIDVQDVLDALLRTPSCRAYQTFDPQRRRRACIETDERQDIAGSTEIDDEPVLDDASRDRLEALAERRGPFALVGEPGVRPLIYARYLHDHICAVDACKREFIVVRPTPIDASLWHNIEKVIAREEDTLATIFFERLDDPQASREELKIASAVFGRVAQSRVGRLRAIASFDLSSLGEPPFPQMVEQASRFDIRGLADRAEMIHPLVRASARRFCAEFGIEPAVELPARWSRHLQDRPWRDHDRELSDLVATELVLRLLDEDRLADLLDRLDVASTGVIASKLKTEEPESPASVAFARHDTLNEHYHPGNHDVHSGALADADAWDDRSTEPDGRIPMPDDAPTTRASKTCTAPDAEPLDRQTTDAGATRGYEEDEEWPDDYDPRPSTAPMALPPTAPPLLVDLSRPDARTAAQWAARSYGEASVSTEAPIEPGAASGFRWLRPGVLLVLALAGGSIGAFATVELPTLMRDLEALEEARRSIAEKSHTCPIERPVGKPPVIPAEPAPVGESVELQPAVSLPSSLFGTQVERVTDGEAQFVDLGRLGSVLPQGQVYIVNLWATWCPPCLEELPHFRDLFRRRQSDEAWKNRVRFVALNVLDTAAPPPGRLYEDFVDRMPARTLFLVDRVADPSITRRLEQIELYRGKLPVTLIVDCERRVRRVVYGAIDEALIHGIELTVDGAVGACRIVVTPPEPKVYRAGVRCACSEPIVAKGTCPRGCFQAKGIGCGNHVCDRVIRVGVDDTQHCSHECTCGNRVCDLYQENQDNCSDDCGRCGDGKCDLGHEDASLCPLDCLKCGDGTRQAGEDCYNCPLDVRCQDGTRCMTDGSCQ